MYFSLYNQAFAGGGFRGGFIALSSMKVIFLFNNRKIMASIKVKFRASTVPGKRGAVYYQVTHRGQVRTVSTGIRLFPEQWDGDSGRLVEAEGVDNGRLAGYRDRIEADVRYFKEILAYLKTLPVDYEVNDIVRRFRTKAFRKLFFLDFLSGRVKELEEAERFGLARSYKGGLNVFKAFLCSKDIPDIPVELIDKRLVNEFARWLSGRGLVRNSVSCYMRVIRAVYHQAVRSMGIAPLDLFGEVYVGVDKTVKRAMRKSLLEKLIALDLEGESHLCFARDMFLFSFVTRGMAFVDIAFLRKKDMVGDTLCYIRRKTGQRLKVFIEPCARAIIERYTTEDSLYLFPILTTTNKAKAHRQYESALNLHNKRLKVISARLGEGVSLSSYVARHTWATIMRAEGVPVALISAGMGHTSERTTIIYLDELEDSAIDQANRDMVNKLGL